MGKAEYVPITTLSRHLQTHQPCASGASLCKLAQKVLLALCLRRTPGTGKSLGFGMAWDQETIRKLGAFQDTGQVSP